MFNNVRSLVSIIVLLSTLSTYAQTINAASFLAVQTNKTNPLFGYLVGPGTEPLSKPVLRPFSTDGCSQSPNTVLGNDIVECCVKHDIAYWVGGTLDEKVASDQQLSQCIENKSNVIAAKAYLAGVTAGGGPNGHNTFRWGYGWDRIRDYGPLTDDEVMQAERLYGKDLNVLKTMVEQKQYTINFELMTLDFTNINRWHDDIIVYYFLQNNLKKLDVVSYAQKVELTSLSFYYKVGLKNCSSNPIRIKLDRTRMILDVVKLYKGIMKMSWEELKTYVLNVEDPGQCLL